MVPSQLYVHADTHGNYLDGLSGPNYSSQNLYVQPPTRSGHPTHQHNLVEDKSNLVPRGRSRGPLLDVSLSQLDRPATPVGLPHHHGHAHSRSRSGLEDGVPSLAPPDPLGSPPRPPPPRPEGEYVAPFVLAQQVISSCVFTQEPLYCFS
jgi:tight junction protein 1